MPTIAFEFLFASITALCGLAGGWYLRGSFLHRPPPDKPESPLPDPIAAAADRGAARESLCQLQDVAERMADDVGQHNTRVQEINDELNSLESQRPEDVGAAVTKLLAANERMQQKLAQAEEKLQEQALQIESHVAAARTDPLTGAANRRAFDDELARCLGEHQRRGRTFSLMMVDIDQFKQFNDTHGHQAGDHVLKSVVRVLRQHVSRLEMVARYGGEEFAVIFPDSNLAAAKPMAERARAAIGSARIEFDGKLLQVSASAGLAELRDTEDGAALIKRADLALYNSKRAGRDCGHWHDGAASHLLKPVTAKPPATPKAAKTEPAKAITPAEATPLRDPLTGLSPRHLFGEDVSRRVSERKRGGPPVSAALLRIDRFDELVARHGEQVGDTLLRAVTQFLKATMRDMDHVARYDRDVFAMLLPGATLDDATIVSERLRRAIERCRLPLGSDPQAQFTVSLGIAEASRSDSSVRLMELTTSALQASLAVGGNKTHLYTGREIVAAAEEAVANA